MWTENLYRDHKSQGIVYKRLNKTEKNALMLHSDNTIYLPYEIKASEILEIGSMPAVLLLMSLHQMI
jgi:hypothetical protein